MLRGFSVFWTQLIVIVIDTSDIDRHLNGSQNNDD